MHGKVHLPQRIPVLWYGEGLCLCLCHWGLDLLPLQNPKIWCLSSWQATWSGSRLGRGIPTADVRVVSWTGCGIEVCREKLLPFLDTLEDASSCVRLLRSTRGRWFFSQCLGFPPKWGWSIS